MKQRILLSLVFLFAPLPSPAQPGCTPTSYATLLACIDARSLERSASLQRIRSAENLPAVARQWSNPELGVESLYKGSEKSETIVSMLFSLPIGGKRSAVIAAAQAELAKARANHDLSLAQYRLETILALYRLSHLRSEIEVSEESVETYGKLIYQFQKKPGLSPEQQVSLAVFRMALSDSELRLLKLQTEEETLSAHVGSLAEISPGTVKKFLPPRKSTWPKIGEAKAGDSPPQLRLAHAERAAAQSELDLASSAIWSDWKLGPQLKMEKENGKTETFFGAGLSFPLPIFSWNGAARELSSSRIAETEIQSELTRRKTESLRAQLAKKYRKIIATLGKTPSPKSLERSHENLERLFFRGMVSSSLVIEAHRQLLELEERQNEAERDAIEALGLIKIIDNDSLEEAL